MAYKVKNLSGNAGDPRSISGSGRSLEKGMAIHSSTWPGEFHEQEEPGGLQSMERLTKSLTPLRD